MPKRKSQPKTGKPLKSGAGRKGRVARASTGPCSNLSRLEVALIAVTVGCACIAAFLVAGPSAAAQPGPAPAPAPKAASQTSPAAARSPAKKAAPNAAKKKPARGRRESHYGRIRVVDEIQRVQWDTSDQHFHRRTAARGTPLIFTGSPADQWAAFQPETLWSPEYLEEKIGAKTMIAVNEMASGNYLYFSEKKAKALGLKVSKKAKTFRQRVRPPAPTRRLFLRRRAPLLCFLSLLGTGHALRPLSQCRAGCAGGRGGRRARSYRCVSSWRGGERGRESGGQR